MDRGRPQSPDFALAGYHIVSGDEARARGQGQVVVQRFFLAFRVIRDDDARFWLNFLFNKF